MCCLVDDVVTRCIVLSGGVLFCAFVCAPLVSDGIFMLQNNTMHIYDTATVSYHHPLQYFNTSVDCMWW